MLALVVAFAAGPSLERAVQIPSRCDTSDDQAAVALPARPQAQRADGGVQISDIDAPRQAGSPITPSEVLKSVDPLGPVPCSAQTTIAHRFDPIAPAEFNERRPDRRHFQIGWTEGYQTNHLGSLSSIPIVQQTGSYQVVSGSPTVPITFPGGSFIVATTSPTGGAIQPRIRSWDDQHDLRLVFAPGGIGSPGWRFSFDGGLDDGTIKESLASPLVAPTPNIQLSATPALNCIILSLFTGQCALFGRSVPFTRQVFQAPGDFNLPTQTQISTFDLTQHGQRYGVAAGAEDTLAHQTPWGSVNLSLGVETRASWWSLTDVRTVAAQPEGPVTAFTAVHRTDIDGPAFSAVAKLGLGGGVAMVAPMTWKVFGDLGSEWASLDVQNSRRQSIRLRGARPISGVGAETRYQLPHDVSLTLGVERRRSVLVSSVFTPPNGGGVTLNDGSGIFVGFHEASSWLFRLAAEYQF